MIEEFPPTPAQPDLLHSETEAAEQAGYASLEAKLDAAPYLPPDSPVMEKEWDDSDDHADLASSSMSAVNFGASISFNYSGEPLTDLERQIRDARPGEVIMVDPAAGFPRMPTPPPRPAMCRIVTLRNLQTGKICPAIVTHVDALTLRINVTAMPDLAQPFSCSDIPHESNCDSGTVFVWAWPERNA